jgi:putative transposase
VAIISLVSGAVVSHQGKNYQVKHGLNVEEVWATDIETGASRVLKIAQIKSAQEKDEVSIATVDMAAVPEEKINKGAEIYKIIEPLLNNCTREELLKQCKAADVSESTMRRYLIKWHKFGNVVDLVSNKSDGGKGKWRIMDSRLAEVIEFFVSIYFTTNEYKNVRGLYKDLKAKCKKEEIKPCSENTLRDRIRANSIFDMQKKAYVKNEPKAPKPGKFPDGKYPLDVVQIDHTQVDLMVVDSEERKPLMRPWITLAIDVFSRMIVGFYLSLRHPSAYSVGQCLINCILRKESYLDKLGIKGSWPVWGFPRLFHADNGKEFRGEMLRLACKYFGKDLYWRPVKTPDYGAHIEKLIGSAMKTIHTIPGTTFSNKDMKGDYNSEKNACLIIDELERVFCTWVVNEYNVQKHEGIKTSPIAMWNLGITKGLNGSLPTGLPDIVEDTDEFRNHFLPVVKRTIQVNGIRIDHHFYYDDVLNLYIKNPPKKKWIFRVNPSQLEKIYFYNDEVKRHFTIPLKNTAIPPFSKEELSETMSDLKEKGVPISEESIHENIERRRSMIEEAKGKTKKARRRKEIKRRDNLAKSVNDAEAEQNTNPVRSKRQLLKMHR